MNPHNGISDNNKKDRTKVTAAIPMVGAIVTAALLLSGLSLISSYQPAIAQQNMTGGGGGTTGGNATTAGGNATTAGGNATTAGGGNQTTSEVRLHLEEVRTALQNDDTETALLHLDLALNALGGNMTTTAGVVGEEVTVEEDGGEEEVTVEEEGGEEGEEEEGEG